MSDINLGDVQHDLRVLSAQMRFVRGVVELLIVALPPQYLHNPGGLGKALERLVADEERQLAKIVEDDYLGPTPC